MTEIPLDREGEDQRPEQLQVDAKISADREVRREPRVAHQVNVDKEITREDRESDGRGPPNGDFPFVVARFNYTAIEQF